MKTVKTQLSRLTANPIGALAGAGAGYYAATKLIHTGKWYATAAVILVGAILGATVQAHMGKGGAPTAAVAKG